MAYDDHVEEHFQKEKAHEEKEQLIIRRSKFRDDLDELLRRYDNAMFNIKKKSIVSELEKAVKILIE